MLDLEKKLKKSSIIFGNLSLLTNSVEIIKFKNCHQNLHIIFMFQKEMADRVIGKFNSQDMGDYLF